MGFAGEREGAISRVEEPVLPTGERMPIVSIDLETLNPAERRDLANALLRAAWSATLAETRTLLLDLLVEADLDVVGGVP